MHDTVCLQERKTGLLESGVRLHDQFCHLTVGCGDRKIEESASDFLCVFARPGSDSKEKD
ncbi:MAG: hypothetical protein DMG76_12360 [Acidobacteria bacterium]|nr:MAG: hypothetical protein DMG76_12360 [Acidobacteriota bacterium]